MHQLGHGPLKLDSVGYMATSSSNGVGTEKMRQDRERRWRRRGGGSQEREGSHESDAVVMGGVDSPEGSERLRL